jgi:hypothetical protein
MRAKTLPLAALSAAAVAVLPAFAQDQAARTVSPVTVSSAPDKAPLAAKVDVGGDESSDRDFLAIWPAGAYQAATDGHVTLACRVDVHGLAEHCEVASETPAGKGFGKAALELRPTFKLKPATGADGQPVAAVMSLGITFVPPKKELMGMQATTASLRGFHDTDTLITTKEGLRGDPLAMRAVTMLDNPVWVRAPDFDNLAKAYPAKGGGVEGYAAAHCQVRDSGELTGCQIIKEDPQERDFGKAALALAARFRVAPDVVARAPHRSSGLWVDIPIRLDPPSQMADRLVMAPAWISGVDPKAAPKVFPAEAVAQGLSTGRGVARCTVAADGTMTACAPETGDPDGLGFSEAAAKLASTMKMNLWSADGAPVEGGVVHIPIRLNLKPQPAG